eukprot:3953890-Prymnesium_polylepis.1
MVLGMLLPDATFGMLRWRIEIAFCTIGCGFGVIVLLLARSSLSFGGGSDGGGGAGGRCAAPKPKDDEGS